MSTANEHNVSCSWRDLRFIDKDQKSETDLLDSLISTLTFNCHSGDCAIMLEFYQAEVHESQVTVN